MAFFIIRKFYIRETKIINLLKAGIYLQLFFIYLKHAADNQPMLRYLLMSWFSLLSFCGIEVIVKAICRHR